LPIDWQSEPDALSLLIYSQSRAVALPLPICPPAAQVSGVSMVLVVFPGEQVALLL